MSTIPSDTERTTLDDWQDVSPDRDPDRPQFDGARYTGSADPRPEAEPSPSADPECQGCGASATPEFVRVFGDDRGQLWACIECATRKQLRAGVGAGLEPAGAHGGHPMEGWR